MKPFMFDDSLFDRVVSHIVARDEALASRVFMPKPTERVERMYGVDLVRAYYQGGMACPA